MLIPGVARIEHDVLVRVEWIWVNEDRIRFRWTVEAPVYEKSPLVPLDWQLPNHLAKDGVALRIAPDNDM